MQPVYTSPLPKRSEERKMEKISPFELKNKLINMAQADARKSTAQFLNAGRGNPNWIATEPREAFFLLGRFGMEECMRVKYYPVGVAGIPASEGIASRFSDFLESNKEQPGARLLKETFEYMTTRRGFDPDLLVHEWAEGIVGDQYPTPDRMLRFTEQIVAEYLAIAMGADGDNYAYDLFATEGGTAAMCYAFDSLQENFLLAKGDTIALMTPIFTPYIEIPRLSRFDFNVVDISANKVDVDGFHTWQYPDSEIDKLRDTKVKLLCLVNPSNPPSYTLSRHTLDRLVDTVKNYNPGLMIITDDVYGTFVDGFRSLMYELPYNTMCVYSFSKYFGATGWRLATIAIQRDSNIFDDKLARLSEADKRRLARRYGSITPDPEGMKFIDRMVADSRMVALNHTAGLSTPQQIQMMLFASMIILDSEGRYQKQMIKMIGDRLKALWHTTGFTLQPDPLRAGYYSEIDIMVWARRLYGDDFAEWMDKHYEPVDFVVRLAEGTAVVLLNGDGFDGPAWSVRASLANLDEDDYLRIGTAIRTILDEYHETYLRQATS